MLVGCNISIFKIDLLKSIIIIEGWNWLYILICTLIIVLLIECLLLKCRTSLKAWLEIKLWLSRLIYLIILRAALFILIEVEIKCWLLILSLIIVVFLDKWNLILRIASEGNRVSCINTILYSIFFLSKIVFKTETHLLRLILHWCERRWLERFIKRRTLVS